ncbi:sugar ABC transporter permease [Arsenicitalea aurantiaca]|uniref:Sugar ABC transporter permease n=1 Tax=Arsenicitalea aurantiaca TaxID=1783274 RepID=A0A433XAI5_9HYPH|nr:sugar ABC transporter permease [Arsenicitalea aurantiaca]RUT31064.1 sugar ABC transporter permease [Arsenicitalea aurantiaca]
MSLERASATRPRLFGGRRLGELVPIIVLAPSLIASFIYVFVFSIWTLYIAMSNSSLLPSYGFVGLSNFESLWANRRWNIAYTNLFFFSGFYIVGSMLVGLLLAILIDQKVRGESVWRTIFLYPLAVSFIVTGTVWSWLYNPVDGIQALVRSFGWTDFSFALASDRNYAIWAIIITGIWQSSGFAMALFLAGLRSVDGDIIRAAQIDGASTFRTYRKVILPSIAPIFLAVAVVQIQFAIKTFDLVVALTRGGPGVSTTFPAIYVYDLMFQRGQIGEGAAAAIMMLAALAVVLVPYSLFLVWRRNKEVRNG